jgi:cobalt/nickel transport system permease protein
MTLLLDIPAAHASPLYRLDPRWKLAALLPAAGAVAALQSLLPALTALATTLLLAAAARLPWRWFAVRIGTALSIPAFLVIWLPFVPRPGDDSISVYGWTLSATGMIHAVVLLMKAASIVTLMLVLLATAPLQDTFKAAQALRIPGWLVQTTLLSYRYVFVIAEEFVRLRTALRVRGYRNRAGLHAYRTIGQVAGTLLVRGHERSERVAQAMRCRGFDGRFRSLDDFHTRAIDIGFFAAVIVGAAAVLTWDLWQRG